MAPYIARTKDGRYGLTGPDRTGYYTLWRITGRPDLEDYEVGAVANPENIETAADAADEEMRCMLADARAEFGA